MNRQYATEKYRPKSPEEIARNMRAIRSAENRTEQSLRSALHCLGLRFRKYSIHLPGRPDIAFPAAKVAVFVDGDYWHARVLQEKGIQALRSSIKKKSSLAYWLVKFKRNVARDMTVTAELRKLGWCVIRLWESDLKGNVTRSAVRVARVVRARADSIMSTKKPSEKRAIRGS